MYRILIGVARVLIFCVVRYKFEGKENIPVRGPVLLVSNHLSVADPVLIGASTGRKVIFMTKEEIFRNPIFGYIAAEWGAFPVHRGETNLETLHQASSILKSGRMLGMFPEGRRSSDLGLQKAFAGSALIARQNRARILPVAIAGTEKIRGFWWFRLRPRVELKIGQAFELPAVQGKVSREQLGADIDLIMRKIAELLPKEYRGCYGADN